MNGDMVPDQVQLRPDSPLRHEEGACLPLRSRHGQCSACAQACPVQVLQVSLDGIALAPGCIGCGRCVAACPTQALMLPELARFDAFAIEVAATPALVRIECRKALATVGATAGTAKPAELEVPCLGSVTPGRLMALHAAGHEVQLVNRGWCAQCEAGCGDIHPAQAAIETATLWLATVTGDATRLPRLVDEPLPLQAMPAAIPAAPALAESLSRRSFFRDAMQRPAGRQRGSPTPMGSHGRALYPAERRQPSPERQRQLDALQRLGAATGQPLPEEFFPALTADSRCCDQRLCVAVCPTAALSVSVNDGGVALEFQSTRCIACGACARACPHDALSLHPHGGTPERQVLIRHTQQACLSCASPYTPGERDAGLCPTCEKSRRFMNDARRQLFGAGARNDPEGPPA